MKKEFLQRAYDPGTNARIDEQFWYAGYDNVDFDKFYKFVKDSKRSVSSSLGYARIGLNNI